MRIGTWNIAGRWSPDHLALIEAMDCDVLLLTEVSEQLKVPQHHLHVGTASMAPRRCWAAILSRTPIEALPDPHPASAMGRVGDWTFCSTILPWKGSGKVDPWSGTTHADRTAATLAALEPHLQDRKLVWGGDWNHALSGPEHAGSKAGRAHLLAVVERLHLAVPTEHLPHRIEGLIAIDHIAVPEGLATTAEHISAQVNGKALSDHDAYVVEVNLP